MGWLAGWLTGCWKLVSRWLRWAEMSPEVAWTQTGVPAGRGVERKLDAISIPPPCLRSIPVAWLLVLGFPGKHKLANDENNLTLKKTPTDIHCHCE